MAGVWRKTMQYLGLVEDEEMDQLPGPPEPDVAEPARIGPRRIAPAGDEEPGGLRRMSRSPAHGDAGVRTIPQTKSAGTIHRAEPKRFNEARELGERFKDGVPVIMNLQDTESDVARRLVDFASGLVFAQDGRIELVAQRVYLLTPADVEVSAEERERIREGGFYNQF